MIFLVMFSSIGQSIFFDGTKYGLIDTDNKVILPAIYDDINNLKKNSLSSNKDLFILRKGASYSFALKQSWETCETNSYGFSCTTDSTKWFLSEDNFDTLYILDSNVSDRTILRYEGYDDEEWGSKVPLSKSRSYSVLGYRKEKLYGIITYEFNLQETKNTHKPGKGVSRDYDYSKTLRSVGNIQIYPEKYDLIIPSSESHPIVTLNGNKYGVLYISGGYETSALFDSIPVHLIEQFYCCKKNGLWGVCFLKEQDSIPLEIIPYQYYTIQALKDDCRELSLYKDGDTEKYPACIYTTTESTVLRLKFIINRLYFGQSGKDYHFPEIKYINFEPQINGKQVIQQKDFEYLFIATVRSNYNSKPPTFFLVKTERKNEENSYDNGKNFDLWSRGSYERERKPKALFAYRLENNTFSLMHEFSEESESCIYDIIDYSNSYHDLTFILKSTHLENGSYIHEFLTCNGDKIYEIKSVHPIKHWDLRSDRSKDAPLSLKFYTTVSGRKGNTEKIICYYNASTGKFSK